MVIMRMTDISRIAATLPDPIRYHIDVVVAGIARLSIPHEEVVENPTRGEDWLQHSVAQML